MTSPDLISVRNLSQRYGAHEDLVGRVVRRLRGAPPRRAVNALNGIDIALRQGEILGIAGESGCGKSTLGRLMVGLEEPSAGQVRYRGLPVSKRGRPLNMKLQMIFQDTGGALNPRIRVRDLIGEAPRLHGRISGSEVSDFVAECLRTVGMPPDAMSRYPHQMSGGQRQRINIARALALDPETIVCDESIAALDVSVQAQILNLFLDLKDRFGLTYTFISHDLGVLRLISDRIAVMYLGRVVEIGPASQIFAEPRHPYTRSLLDNVPTLAKRKHQFVRVKGEVPSPLDLPPGCAYHTRCPLAQANCRVRVPELQGPEGGHRHACPVVEKVDA